MPKTTPMMERYQEVKRQNPGSLLLFRMGDFYELFHEDAKVGAKALGLTLTSRDKNSDNPVPMAGFPYHQLENYLQKLIAAGFRAAICDQVEDPKQAKGLVKREVTRVVTPGTLTDDALLDPRQSNFLACVFPGRERIGLAWLELSDGSFFTSDVEPAHLADELARIYPAECLVPEESFEKSPTEPIPSANGMVLTHRPAWNFSGDEARRVLLEHFDAGTLEGFGLDESSPGVTAAGALLEYVRETQKSSLGHIRRIQPFDRGEALLIDEATRRSLELTQTLREGKREGSLLAVIDETVTPMGARLLAEWLSNPLTDVPAIERRLDAVAELAGQGVRGQRSEDRGQRTEDGEQRSEDRGQRTEDGEQRTEDGASITPSLHHSNTPHQSPVTNHQSPTHLARDLHDQLKNAYDVQRLVSRVATGRCSPRDLTSLAATLALLPAVKAKLAGRSSDLLAELESQLDLCPEVRADIDAALVDDPPITITDGNVIRDGYHAELDELRELARGGKQWIAEYQAQEAERTGITNLKVGFNKVFGYYLEVTAANADKVPDNYIRKQTLKNQERFITPELKEYEDKVLTAQDRAILLEQELFTSLRERVAGHTARLQQTASVLAQTDVLAGLATLAINNRYCRPEMTADPILDIREGRHPVLDRLQPSGEFVPNDVVMGLELRAESLNPSAESKDVNGERRQPSALSSQPSALHLITGPNMAGKSTYIRQAALLTVMAQIGSFLPASEARVGVADRIFARVGASDELGKGQSTFMVEMTETARILNLATPRSLVILDEIGRGTSTYDGISLAWAVTEYLHDEISCRTLFATHYHELTELAQTLPGVSNWNVAVREDRDDVIFLHKIVPGTADKSYGIHVARLAGVPRSVVERAKVILETLEADHLDDEGKPRIPDRPMSQATGPQQLSLFGGETHPLLDDLRELNLDELTPLAALQELHRMRAALNNE